MLKFVKHHMATIAGIEIFPIISFLIFFLFFLILGIMVFKMNRSFIQNMAALPLDGNDKTEDP